MSFVFKNNWSQKPTNWKRKTAKVNETSRRTIVESKGVDGRDQAKNYVRIIFAPGIRPAEGGGGEDGGGE